MCNVSLTFADSHHHHRREQQHNPADARFLTTHTHTHTQRTHKHIQLCLLHRRDCFTTAVLHHTRTKTRARAHTMRFPRALFSTILLQHTHTHTQTQTRTHRERKRDRAQAHTTYCAYCPCATLLQQLFFSTHEHEHAHAHVQLRLRARLSTTLCFTTRTHSK